jgi:hypothetical protein
MPEVCLLCIHFGNSNQDYSTLRAAKIAFINASIATLFYRLDFKYKYTICYGHMAILSQYFKCHHRLSDNKLRINSNAINAIIHLISFGTFCTYTDPHGTLHIYDKTKPMGDFIEQIILLEWGIEYYSLVRFMFLSIIKQYKEKKELVSKSKLLT